MGARIKKSAFKINYRTILSFLCLEKQSRLQISICSKAHFAIFKHMKSYNRPTTCSTISPLIVCTFACWIVAETVSVLDNEIVTLLQN